MTWLQLNKIDQRINEIEKIIDVDGIVRSSASPELAKIRKELNKSKIEADRIYIRR